VILLSLRYDRIDNFWFTLMHEVAHVAAGHRGIFIDNDLLERKSKDPEELAADKSAQDWLIDAGSYGEFVEENGPQFSRRNIIRFARQIGRHPGIVLGRLHHEGKLHFSRLRHMLDKVRPVLADFVDVVIE
jgi:HTH-type transcriptional regulator/antitoxin HigA